MITQQLGTPKLFLTLYQLLNTYQNKGQGAVVVIIGLSIYPTQS